MRKVYPVSTISFWSNGELNMNYLTSGLMHPPNALLSQCNNDTSKSNSMTIHVNYEAYISMNECRMDKFYFIYIYFILNYFKLFRSRRFSVIYIFLKITYTKLLVQESLQCLNFQLADQLTSTMYFSSLAET